MKYFFDTYILVYMQDTSDLAKQSVARKLFYNCSKEKTAVISTQVLQEFYNISTGKLQQDKKATKTIIRNFSANLEVVQVSCEIIDFAIDLNMNTQFSIWDSLILASAINAECSLLYTEDLNSGQIVDGVKIVNPFAS